MKSAKDMTDEEFKELVKSLFPALAEPLKPNLKTKEQRERDLQFGACNEHLQWWIEQNRLDAMRRGE